jgi:hypothetical protein
MCLFFFFFAGQDPGDLALEARQRVLVTERTSEDWYVLRVSYALCTILTWVVSMWQVDWRG